MYKIHGQTLDYVVVNLVKKENYWIGYCHAIKTSTISTLGFHTMRVRQTLQGQRMKELAATQGESEVDRASQEYFT